MFTSEKSSHSIDHIVHTITEASWSRIEKISIIIYDDKFYNQIQDYFWENQQLIIFNNAYKIDKEGCFDKHTVRENWHVDGVVNPKWHRKP